MAMLTADAAATRLGIKVESLYAYVSRGLIERHLGTDGRSRFDDRSVEALARRGRPRISSRQSSLNLLIETHLTSIDSHHIYYRGHDALALAGTHTFEQVAELLWSGRLPLHDAPWAGTVVPMADGIGLTDSLAITTATLAAADPQRANLDPLAVAGAARHLIASMVASLPHGVTNFQGATRQVTTGHVTTGHASQLTVSDSSSRHRRVRRSIAGTLWAAVGRQRAQPGMVEVVNAALVLLADHELAASTLAARVAASTRADPYSVVAAGLGTINGPLHGGASLLVRDMLTEASASGANQAVAHALRSWGRVPGFGQKLYPDGDPRAVVLLRMLHQVAGKTRAMATVDAVLDVYQERSDHRPNIDFALAALGLAAKLPPESGELI
ncbi:MAG: citrate/2-methylcitrate synthase, partial [Ilumatobacteraceae bacterium]